MKDLSTIFKKNVVTPSKTYLKNIRLLLVIIETFSFSQLKNIMMIQNLANSMMFYIFPLKLDYMISQYGCVPYNLLKMVSTET